MCLALGLKEKYQYHMFSHEVTKSTSIHIILLHRRTKDVLCSENLQNNLFIIRSPVESRTMKQNEPFPRCKNSEFIKQHI